MYTGIRKKMAEVSLRHNTITENMDDKLRHLWKKSSLRPPCFCQIPLCGPVTWMHVVYWERWRKEDKVDLTLTECICSCLVFTRCICWMSCSPFRLVSSCLSERPRSGCTLDAVPWYSLGARCVLIYLMSVCDLNKCCMLGLGSPQRSLSHVCRYTFLPERVLLWLVATCR